MRYSSASQVFLSLESMECVYLVITRPSWSSIPVTNSVPYLHIHASWRWCFCLAASADEILLQSIHALAVTLRGKVRVNSISPGWIDTDFKEYEGADAVQQPAGRVGNPMDIANMVLFLCSDKGGFITGENICIDGGMTRQMIYHGDHGWTLTE